MPLCAGQPAPAFHVRSDDGRVIDLTALRGHWAVLFFRASFAAPAANRQAQALEAALPEFERLGARVIGVSADPEAQLARLREQFGWTFPVVPDGPRTLAGAYGVGGWLARLTGRSAHTFLIDPQGCVAQHWRGNADPTTLLQTLRGKQTQAF